MNLKIDWEIISFVFRSEYRLAVLESIMKDPKTPKQISKKTGLRINHVSNILKGLLDHKLAICLNPLEKRGRFYQITDRGKEVFQKIKQLKQQD